MAMALLNPDTVRTALQGFLARKGHGAVKDVAERTGLSRMTVARFRDGGGPDEITLTKIASVLAEEGYLDPEFTEARAPNAENEIWAANRRLLQGIASRDPNALIAARLFNIAETLMSDDFSQDQKVEEFVTFIEMCHRSLDAYTAALKKGAKVGTD